MLPGGEGKGLRGWVVMAMGSAGPAGNRTTERRTTTDADGKFVLPGLTWTTPR
jgi:predicted amidohydrolase YtcJ